MWVPPRGWAGPTKLVPVGQGLRKKANGSVWEPLRGVVQSRPSLFGSRGLWEGWSRATLPCSVRGAFEGGGPEPLFRFEGPLRGGGSRTPIPYITAWLQDSDQWKAKNLADFCNWPTTRCFIQIDRARQIIVHSTHFALSGNIDGPCHRHVFKLSKSLMFLGFSAKIDF